MKNLLISKPITFKKLLGFKITNQLYVFVMKSIIILTLWPLPKSSFIMLKPKLKENGEPGLSMLKKVKLLSAKEAIGLPSL